MVPIFGSRTARIRALEKDNNALRAQIQAMKEEYDDLENWNISLLQEISKLKENLKLAQKEAGNLQYENHQLRDNKERLEEWNTELTQRLENFSVEEKKGFFRAEDSGETKFVIVETEASIEATTEVISESKSEQKVHEFPADMPWYEVIDIEDTRASNVLMRRGVETIGELLSCTALGILDMRDCGEITLNNVVYALGGVGLRLAAEDDIQSQRRANRCILPALRRLTKIEALIEYGLSIQTYNMLRVHGYRTIGDFFNRYERFALYQLELSETEREHELRGAIARWREATILSYNTDHM